MGKFREIALRPLRRNSHVFIFMPSLLWDHTHIPWKTDIYMYFAAGIGVSTFCVRVMVKGYHIYGAIWTTAVNEELGLSKRPLQYCRSLCCCCGEKGCYCWSCSCARASIIAAVQFGLHGVPLPITIFVVCIFVEAILSAKITNFSCEKASCYMGYVSVCVSVRVHYHTQRENSQGNLLQMGISQSRLVLVLISKVCQSADAPGKLKKMSKSNQTSQKTI